jgi:hypothetical protein
MGSLDVLMLISFVLACGSEQGIYLMDGHDQFMQRGTDYVDILWVIDDSSSMASEQTLVSEGFQNFIYALAPTDNTGVQMGVITTDMDADNPDRGALLGEPAILTQAENFVVNFIQRVEVGVDGSDMERGLEAAWFALTDPSVASRNSGFLRDDANLAVIFVTDENDCSDEGGLPAGAEGRTCYDATDKLVPVNEYVDRFNSLKGEGLYTIAGGILGPSVESGCQDSWPGHRYSTLIEQTGGVEGNICETDYRGMMTELGNRITGPMTVFTLSEIPIPESIEVVVGDTVVPEGWWLWDEEYNTIRFDGSYVPEWGSVIYVDYTIAHG